VKILNKYQHHNVTITCFTQSSFPRIDRDHYTPVPLEPFSPETVSGVGTARRHARVGADTRRCGVGDPGAVRFPSRGTRFRCLSPLLRPASQQEGWYPPGHGDVYRALDRSGVLDSLLAQGKEIIFISNVDNLGATVDLNVSEGGYICFSVRCAAG
jgi:UDP-N-acetylglucosamine pyrophosphorylase